MAEGYFIFARDRTGSGDLDELARSDRAEETQVLRFEDPATNSVVFVVTNNPAGTQAGLQVAATEVSVPVPSSPPSTAPGDSPKPATRKKASAKK